VSRFALLASLVIGVIATGLIVWMSTVKEQHWDRARTKLENATAEANARALEAQLALEKYQAPRMISTNDRDKIVAALKPFSCQQYSLSVAAGAEAENLLCSLNSLLSASEWKLHAPFGTITVGTRCGKSGVNTLSGLDVRVAKIGISQDTIAAADTLIAELNGAGIATKGATDPENIPDAAVIAIMVGSKP
jgi:hypothetical protein